MLSFTVFITALALVAGVAGVYVDFGNPYDDGPLMSSVKYLRLTKENDSIPLSTLVIYPDVQEKLGVVVFYGGMYGILPADVYEIVLEKVASHGFIVMAPWVVTGSLDYVQESLDTLDWASRNLGSYFEAEASFEHLSMACHSAGCQVVLDLIKHDEKLFKAAVMLEPASFFLNNPLPYKVPSIMYGAELANGTCSIPGLDFVQWYNIWNCPRIILEVAEFGHCDFLDPEAFFGCVGINFCASGPLLQIPRYRQFVQGVVSAHLITYVQEQPEAIKYLTDVTTMPLKIKMHDYDLDCQ